MKYKIAVVSLLAVLLAGTGYFLYQSTRSTGGVATQIDVVSDLVTQLNVEKKRQPAKPAASGADPEEGLARFVAYLESDDVSKAIARYKIRDELRYRQKPSPRYETRVDVTFDFSRMEEAQALINSILMQRLFFVRFDDFSVKETMTGKLRGTLSVTHIFHTASASQKDGLPKSLVVLLESPDGTVGKIQVSNQHGSRILDKKGYAISLEDTGKAPAQPFEINKTRLRRMLSKTMEAQNEAPVTFVLYFESGKTTLSGRSRQTVPRMVSAIKARTRPKIRITGHSDRSGNKQYNETLALNRARAVEQLLLDAGVRSSWITRVASRGENNPIIQTRDGANEPRNRRVEVSID